MTLVVLVHEALWKELDTTVHEVARLAMSSVGSHNHPNQHPDVKSIAGSKYPGSSRLRLGRWRLIFIFFPDERTLAFTTAFLKKRESDYTQAIARHDSRVKAFE